MSAEKIHSEEITELIKIELQVFAHCFIITLRILSTKIKLKIQLF